MDMDQIKLLKRTLLHISMKEGKDEKVTALFQLILPVVSTYYLTRALGREMDLSPVIPYLEKYPLDTKDIPEEELEIKWEQFVEKYKLH